VRLTRPGFFGVVQLVVRMESLLDAAHNGDVMKVKALVELGANVDQRKDGWTPLHAASRRGHVGVLLALAEAGANVEALRNGRTPLWWAAHRGHAMAVKALLAAGANVLALGSDRNGPLLLSPHYTAEVVTALVAAGANLGRGGEKVVFVKNFRYQATAADLTQFFSQWGEQSPTRNP
jgi:ankyrin repeat protein